MSKLITITAHSIALLRAKTEFGKLVGQVELPDGLFQIRLDDEVYEKLMKVNSDPDTAIEIACTQPSGWA